MFILQLGVVPLHQCLAAVAGGLQQQQQKPFGRQPGEQPLAQQPALLFLVVAMQIANIAPGQGDRGCRWRAGAGLVAGQQQLVDQVGVALVLQQFVAVAGSGVGKQVLALPVLYLGAREAFELPAGRAGREQGHPGTQLAVQLLQAMGQAQADFQGADTDRALWTIDLQRRNGADHQVIVGQPQAGAAVGILQGIKEHAALCLRAVAEVLRLL